MSIATSQLELAASHTTRGSAIRRRAWTRENTEYRRAGCRRSFNTVDFGVEVQFSSNLNLFPFYSILISSLHILKI